MSCRQPRLTFGRRSTIIFIRLIGRHLPRWQVRDPWEESLANLKSSIKRIRSSRRRAGYNQITRSTARTYVKKARRLIDEGRLDEAREVVHQAIRALDRAAQKKVIHRNNAARRKSRLVKELNQALQA